MILRMRDNILWILVVVALVGSGVSAWISYNGDSKGISSGISADLGNLGKDLPWLNTGDAIGVLRLEGPIMDTRWHQAQIRKWCKDESIKGIMLEINSPGGAVAPSQSLYDAVLKCREQKPIFAAIESVGASGAYYVASAADKIYSVRGSLVGSIGVIMQNLEFSDAAAKIGVVANTIKTGALKDTGNPFRPMSVTETQYLQSVANATFLQFKNDIVNARGVLTMETLEPLATGRIFIGTEAVELKLVDELGDNRKALGQLAAQVGLDPDNPSVRKPAPQWERFESILGEYMRSPLDLQQKELGLNLLWHGYQVLAR